MGSLKSGVFPNGQAWVDVDREQLLAGVVQGEVLGGLKEAEFADGLGGDAAGGQIGDGAGGEFEAYVGDVHLATEDGQTDGADLAHGRTGQSEQDVEVVDHEVQDDVDVERARGEDREAMGLKEHGTGEPSEGGGDGGVKPLEVTGGEDAAEAIGVGDETVGFRQGGGERFLDEQVDAGRKELRGYGCVRDGGNTDSRSMQIEIGREQSVD